MIAEAVLEELEALGNRCAELERLVGVLARMADPTATQLSREDRDALVAYARSTRDDSLPSVSHEPG